MSWQRYLAFFAGVFLVNGLPHFLHGISGERFPTPFPKPEGKRTSAPLVNVLWGTVNFAIGLVLVRLSKLTFGFNRECLTVALGGFLTAVIVAIHFGLKNIEAEP